MLGGEAMTIFESIYLMISFALLVVAILSFHHKK
ncbi:putative holin-like toxin [Chengkuizengella marina]